MFRRYVITLDPPPVNCLGGEMGCYDPVLVLQLNNRKIYRNWSMASHVVRVTAESVFDCGKCLSCRRKNARELARRVVLHASIYRDNCFVTLTYDPSREGYHNRLDYADIQKFKKRLREKVRRLDGRKIEIFNVHEYGAGGKKHWHLIVFNYDFSDKVVYTIRKGIPLYTSNELEGLWPFGFSTVGDVSEGSAMYQAQYTQKDIKNGNDGSTKKAKSNHSGLGKPYFYAFFKQCLSLGFIPFRGEEMPLPRYFEKIAHKHWCHFYDTSAFFKTLDRKALYRVFKQDGSLYQSPNKEMADLYVVYLTKKEERIKERKADWEKFVNEYDLKVVPDFVKSGENAVYDLKNKLQHERF